MRSFAIKLLRVTVVSLVAAFLGIFGGFYSTFCPVWNPDLTERVLFHECRGILNKSALVRIAGIQGEDVRLPVRGAEAKVDAWYYKVPGSKKVFLFSHGNAGNCSDRSQKISWLLSTGQSVMIYDYEGFGMSSGRATPKHVVDDVCAAFDYLTKKERYNPYQVIAYGESIGTGVSAELLARRRPGAVVLESGFTSIESLGKELYPVLKLFPHSLWPTPGLRTIDQVKKTHVPVLIIHGRNDTIIPVHHAQENYAAAHEPKQLLILEHSNHNNCSEDLNQYMEGLRKLLRSDFSGKNFSAML